MRLNGNQVRNAFEEYLDALDYERVEEFSAEEYREPVRLDTLEASEHE